MSEQQIEHVNGQLAALAWDLRQAKANGDQNAVTELEVKADHLNAWKAEHGPNPTPEDPCPAKIHHYPHQQIEATTFHCDRPEGHAGCHWNDVRAVIWSR